MEIDKDKVASLAQALLDEYNRGDIDPFEHYEEIWNSLKEALNPPPARPSKEECIEWLEHEKTEMLLLLGEKVISDNINKYNMRVATIEYLKEPSLQWVKNTGVEPQCERVLIKYASGGIYEGDPSIWAWDTSIAWAISEYIILE